MHAAERSGYGFPSSVQKLHLVFTLAVLSCASACDLVLGIRELPPRVDATTGEDTASVDAGDASDAGASDADATLDDADDATPETADVGCDADLERDPENCDVCGHSCLGGGCIGRRCQPVLLTSSEVWPLAIAVDPGDDGYIFAADYKAQNLVRIAKDGSERRVLYHETNTNLPLMVAILGANVYLLETTVGGGPSSTIVRVDHDGANLRKLDTGGWTFGMSINRDGVFWINRIGANRIWRSELDFSGPKALRAVDPGVDEYSIVADEDPSGFVYWAGNDGVWRMHKDGTATTQLALYGTVPIAIDATSLFYASGEPGQPADQRFVFRIPKEGCTDAGPGDCRSTLTDGLVAKTVDPSLVLDGEFLDVVHLDGRHALRYPKLGGPPVTLISGVNVTSSAHDTRFVYFGTNVRGVYRVAK